jgi:RND family efflux transporter MFP subunit
VDALTVELGQYLKNGDSVARILQIDRIKVIAGIPESDVNAIRSAKEFLITIDALNKKTFKGTYNYLSRSTNSLAHAYQLEIAVSNLESEILPGMFARAEIVKKQISNALSVPLFALLPYKNSHAVLIASHGRAKQVPVTTGIQEGWEVQVVNGLSPGDQVIVVGQRDIGDGAPVKILRTVSNVEDLR